MPSFRLAEDSCLLSCPDISLIWIKCAKTAESVLGPRSRGVVTHCGKHITEFGQAHCLVSYGARAAVAMVRSRGVPCGRGWRRIVWII